LERIRFDAMLEWMETVHRRWLAISEATWNESTIKRKLEESGDYMTEKRFTEAMAENELRLQLVAQKFQLGGATDQLLSDLDELQKDGERLRALELEKANNYRENHARIYGMVQVNEMNLARQQKADKFEIEFRRIQAKTEKLENDPFVRVPCKPITLWATPATLPDKIAISEELKAKEAEEKKKKEAKEKAAKEGGKKDDAASPDKKASAAKAVSFEVTGGGHDALVTSFISARTSVEIKLPERGSLNGGLTRPGRGARRPLADARLRSRALA